jgi:hypothetical protein
MMEKKELFYASFEEKKILHASIVLCVSSILAFFQVLNSNITRCHVPKETNKGFILF